ncbi:MAG: M56 family metallopeptidase [Bacteroidota bacterium]
MIISNLISALGWTLLHSLWQGSLLFLLLVPLFHLLAKRPPQLRYGIACGALLVLVGSMVATFYSELELTRLSPVPTATLSTSASISTAMAEIVPPATVAQEVVAAGVPTNREASFSLTRLLEDNLGYLVIIWGLGVVFFTLRWCSILLLTFRLRHQGTRKLPMVWEERMLQLKRRMGIKRIVAVVESSRIDTPLVIGHLKPIILLPIGLVNGLSVAQVEAILAHELAHVQRYDFLVNILLTGLEVVLFYHPVYWWLVGKINEERELCCDDAAVAACGNPRLYAQTLLSVEEYRQESYLALAFAKKGEHLFSRVQRICQTTPRHYQSFSPRLWLVIPLVAFAVVFAYAGISPANEANNHSPQASLAVSQDGDALAEEFNTQSPAEKAAVISTPSKEVLETAIREELTMAPSNPTEPSVAITDAEIMESPASAGGVVAISVAPDSLPMPMVQKTMPNPSFVLPPSFSLTEEEIKDLLDKETEGRKALRQKVNEYRVEVENWNDQVRDDYLQNWEDYRLRVLAAYEDWRSELKANAKDELSYAMAHNRMTESFRRALDQSEDKLEEKEDAIEDQPERGLERLERVLERGEKPLKDHSDRMDLHSTRMAMHSARMQVHSGRMKVHSQRMKIHSTRMQLHSDRMKSHQIIMAALEADLREALIADGLLDEDDKYFHFKVTHDAVSFNRKVIEPASKAQKYLDILARYGMGDMSGQPPGNSFIIHHHENGSTVGTQRKN